MSDYVYAAPPDYAENSLCPACHTAVSPNAAFCRRCGQSLRSPVRAAPNPYAGQPHGQAAPAYDPAASKYASLVGHSLQQTHTADRQSRAVQQHLIDSSVLPPSAAGNPYGPPQARPAAPFPAAVMPGSTGYHLPPPAPAAEAAAEAPVRKPLMLSLGKRTVAAWKVALPALLAVATLTVLLLGTVFTQKPGALDDFLLYMKDDTLFFAGMGHLEPTALITDLPANSLTTRRLNAMKESVRSNDEGTRIFFTVWQSSKFVLHYYEPAQDKLVSVSAVDTDDEYKGGLYWIGRAGDRAAYLLNGDLMVYDLEESAEIEQDVTSAVLSRDGLSLLYMKGQSLYFRPLSGELSSGASLLVDSSVTTFSAADPEYLDELYYIKRNALYRWTPQYDRERVSFNVSELYETSGGLYYLSKGSTAYPLTDFFKDDLAAVIEPVNPPNSPDYSDYATGEYDEYGNELYDDDAYYAAAAVYEEEYRHYYALIVQIQLRKTMATAVYEPGTLYRLHNGEAIPVAESVLEVLSPSTDRKELVVSMLDPTLVSKTALSQIASSENYDISYLIENIVSKNRHKNRVIVLGSSCIPYHSKAASTLTAAGAGVYFCLAPAPTDGTPSSFSAAESSAAYSLIRMEYRDNRWTAEEIDSRVYSFRLTDDNRVIYFKRSDSSVKGAGDLYENGEVLAENIALKSVFPLEGAGRLIGEEVDSSGVYRQLVCIEGGRAYGLDVGETSFSPGASGRFYFLNDDGLYSSDGRDKPFMIDEDVDWHYVFPPSAADDQYAGALTVLKAALLAATRDQYYD